MTRKAPGEDLDLVTLQTSMEEKLVAREHSRGPTRGKHTWPPPRAVALLSGTQQSIVKSKLLSAASRPKCMQCGEGTRFSSTSSDDCWTMIQLCYQGTFGERVSFSSSMSSMQEEAHPSICDPRFVDTRTSANLVELTNVTISTLNPLASPYVSNSNTSALCSTTMNSVLIQTA